MKKLEIKKLLEIDKFYLYDNMHVGGILVFEDGVELELNSNEFKLTRFMLEPLVKLKENQKLKTENVVLNSDLYIRNFYSNGIYTSKTIDKFISTLNKTYIRTFLEPNKLSKKIMDIYHKYCVEVYDEIYNYIACENLEYVTDIDILDFMELQFDPDLTKAMEESDVLKTQEAIDNTYKVLAAIVRKDIYSSNPIAEGYIAGTMNPNQINQMLGSRGFVTEINGHIFNTPVTRSFVKGLNLYEFCIETRSGAKALYMTVVAVEKAEYLARELQLVTTIVERITEGDCGSKDYMDWYIRTKDENNGKSDLDNLLGKYYLDESTNTLKAIDKSDKHLEGTTVKLRHVKGCKLSNPRHICQKCFGEMAYSLFNHNNAGYISTTHSSHKVTQNLISTKHLTQSAKAESVNLSDEVSKYFITKFNQYYFRANVNFSKGSHILIIEQNELNGLNAITSGSLDPDKINPVRLSRLKSVILEVNNRNGQELVEVHLQSKSTFGVFTKEAIRYIMTNSYRLDEYDRVIIDLENWDNKQPMFYTPEVEFSYLDLANEIKSMFKAMKDDETPESLLQKFFDAVNTRLSINLSLLETVVYGFSVYDYEKGDYRLGRNSPNPAVRKLENIITNRSLGVSYGWERLLNIIFNPKVYYGKNSIGTPMDLVIKPNEVVKEYLEMKK